ncbi:Hypothetical protein FKW44_021318 [Caligus rogercresseyi]|uniref:Uncharacterized protein n=1 Tax=Caligus rogercresseyi TaxID=217165 RepID=A0A7T8GRL1_CALRO|nr:Hypothetical protein FKW44_021318 [Caligus rogercresseyi]
MIRQDFVLFNLDRVEKRGQSTAWQIAAEVIGKAKKEMVYLFLKESKRMKKPLMPATPFT